MSVSRATTTSAAEARIQSLSDSEKRQLLARLLRDKAAGARVFDMSIGQAALWHAFQRNPNSTAYSVFLPTRIRSHLNAGTLKACIEQLAGRHQCLRTSFEQSDGRLLQRVHGELKPGYIVRDVAGASDEQIENLVLEEALRPFDLNAGPLVRLSVFKVADDDWVILAQAHHIVVDFWSLVIILSELRVLYPQLLAGQPATLPPPQNNYQRFVTQQHALLGSEGAQRHMDYWKSALKDVAPIVELPLDRQRPEGFTGRANVQGIEFAADLGQQVAELARDLRATPFAVVHAAVQLFVSRLSRQDLFFIGSPFSGRSQREYEQTVGFFVNVLPVRCDLQNSPTFADLVTRTGQSLADALDHEAYPLSEIVRIGDIPRDSSRSPLFQVSCTFEKSQKKEESGRGGFLFPGETQAWQFGGMRQESFFLPHPTCHYDLEFVFELNDDRLKGMMVYCRDLFSAESMANLSEAFSSLFAEAVRSSTTSIESLGWSSELRSTVVLPDSTTQPEDALPENTLPGQILSAAVDSPDVPALVHGSTTITYRQWVSAAEELSRSLKSRGVAPEVLVPVECQPGPAAMIGMLAVHLAGGAPVPIDSTQSHADLHDLVRETNAPILVSDRTDSIECGVPHAVVDLPAADAQELSDSQISDLLGSTLALSPRSLAYMVYTSGSTGKPKGVLVEHRAVCNTLSWRRRAVPLTSGDRVLYTLSHQFDAGLGIAWAALTQGACLVWASDVNDPSQIVKQLQSDQITVLPAVPSVHELLVTHPDFVNCNSLRYVWTGGESMASTLPEKIRKSTQAAFWNFYGPTEAAIEATACDVTAHPAGRPI
ncbi:MAG TPA: polyketide synthase, partial [Planctomycetaceae bacterium]|nr:polyketide synthase [Planctomycetaceae bacterium]